MTWLCTSGSWTIQHKLLDYTKERFAITHTHKSPKNKTQHTVQLKHDFACMPIWWKTFPERTKFPGCWPREHLLPRGSCKHVLLFISFCLSIKDFSIFDRLLTLTTYLVGFSLKSRVYFISMWYPYSSEWNAVIQIIVLLICQYGKLLTVQLW